MMTKPLPVLLALALLAASSPVLAADAASDAAAEALFQEAKVLEKAGDCRGALPKFLEAQRLSGSVGTLLNIGNCYERVGQLASAFGAFKSAQIMAHAGRDPREDEAVRRADALAPKLAKVAIVVPPIARIPGLEVKRDGEIVGEGQWGSALPVDAGEHTIEASAPGRRKWTTKVQVAASGGSVAVSVPELPAAPLELAPADAATRRLPTSFWSGQRIAGATVVGAGLVSIVVGSVFTAGMVSKNHESMPYCLPKDPNTCYAQGVDLRAQALDSAHVATVTWIAGGVALTGGLIVFLTAPRASTLKASSGSIRWDVQPAVGPGIAALNFRGAW